MVYQSYHDSTTRSDILRAVADITNAAAWERFFNLYAGFVFSIARSKGLSADMADEVVQDVFISLARKMPTFNYDRQKGRFRSYLLGLVNWRIIDKLKAEKRENDLKAAYIDEVKAGLNTTSNSKTVEQAWQSAAIKEALRRLSAAIRPEHFSAFVESTIEGIDTETVMRLHNLTRDNLYQVRKRCTDKLKKLVAVVLNEMNGETPPFADGEHPRR